MWRISVKEKNKIGWAFELWKLALYIRIEPYNIWRNFKFGDIFLESKYFCGRSMYFPLFIILLIFFLSILADIKKKKEQNESERERRVCSVALVFLVSHIVLINKWEWISSHSAMWRRDGQHCSVTAAHRPILYSLQNTHTNTSYIIHQHLGTDVDPTWTFKEKYS